MTAAGLWENLIATDQRLSARLRAGVPSRGWRALASFLAHSGDSWFCIAGLVLVGWLAPDWREWVIKMAIGIAVVAGGSQILKWLVRRRRPAGEWGGLYRRTDPHSFPSGHAARMAVLLVLALALGPGWLAVLLLAWLPAVALAQVAMGVHYLSDVVAGMGLGLVLGGVLLLFF